MKGTPAQIMARLGVMAGTLHGNQPYSNDGVQALYGPQDNKKAPQSLARLTGAKQNNQLILPRTTEKDNIESNSAERRVRLR